MFNIVCFCCVSVLCNLYNILHTHFVTYSYGYTIINGYGIIMIFELMLVRWHSKAIKSPRFENQPISFRLKLSAESINLKTGFRNNLVFVRQFERKRWYKMMNVFWMKYFWAFKVNYDLILLLNWWCTLHVRCIATKYQ